MWYYTTIRCAISIKSLRQQHPARAVSFEICSREILRNDMNLCEFSQSHNQKRAHYIAAELDHVTRTTSSRE